MINQQTIRSQIDRNEFGQSPLMRWIQFRRNEAIPENLYYDGYQTDKNKDGETPQMIWSEYHPNEPIPQELIYPAGQQNYEDEIGKSVW